MKKIVALLLITASTSPLFCGLSHDKETSPEPTTYQMVLTHVQKKITQSLQRTAHLVGTIHTTNAKHQTAFNQINGAVATTSVPAPTGPVSRRIPFTAEQIMKCMQALHKDTVSNNDVERYYARLNDLEGDFAHMNLHGKK